MQAYAINVSAVRRPDRRPERARRRARTLRLLLVLLVALLVLVFAPRVVQTAGRTTVPQTVSHVVTPGETLWEIASVYSPGGDVRRLIAAIKRLNGLNSATVYPGQALEIPVESAR